MVSKNDIKGDIQRLEAVASAIEEKNYVLAFKSCVLFCDIYYKDVTVIERQLFDNIRYDAHKGTSYAKDYAEHLKRDAEYVLSQMED